MGLDAVELVIAYESAFEVTIPDAAAERMLAPAAVVNFLLPLLGEARSPAQACLCTRAFYRIRSQLVCRGYRRGTLSPRSRIPDLLGPEASQEWKGIGRALGYEHWPRLRPQSRILGWIDGAETLGQAARETAVMNPRRLHPEPWTRVELEQAVMRITELELGLQPGKFTVDSRFVADMRIS